MLLAIQERERVERGEGDRENRWYVAVGKTSHTARDLGQAVIGCSDINHKMGI